ncbi:unnamed protein product [Oppiella nova]|uniref:Protein kinase domain-containing protein n=1 Tax=Oppiella nova TaxID=334625 RepID=A0A7R9LHU4_9ACAR|nr:unnamed protein product [Oppiella nova]CAG2163100.1 unnamed protein product [Oppiella nova]
MYYLLQNTTPSMGWAVMQEDVWVWVTTHPSRHHNLYLICGYTHSLALSLTEQVYGWGDNSYNNTFVELTNIGSGGFGTVHKIQNKNDDKIYAIKIQQINDLNKYEKSNAFNEGKKLLLVQSEYVVKYYDSWREGNCIYIQMELCSQNLRNVIQIKPQVFGRQLGYPMDCVEYFISCEIFRQILESVEYLHELNPQIIHRDLKPDNILISENVKNGRFVKLCDFGLATVHDKRVHYRTTQKHTANVGDIKYMAPEVSQGEKYGHKSDIYSLALIAGELFDVNLNEIDLDE